jgi:hypothetical protein
MRHLALIAIIVFGLSQQPTKPPERKDDLAKGSSVQVADQAYADKDNKPTVQTPPVPDNNANKSTTDEELKTQRGLMWFTGALVVVSFLQFAALIWQACLFFRQAGIMDEHRVHLEKLAIAASDNAKAAKDGAEASSKNAEFSKLNAAATEKSANAAKASAEAALLNAQALINAERPWVTVKVTRLMSIKGRPYFRFDMVNNGKSAARILSCVGPVPDDYRSPEKDLPTPPNYPENILWVDRFLAPGDSFQMGFVNLFPISTISQRQERCTSRGIEDLKDAQFVAYGRIEYTDGVSAYMRETRFCYYHIDESGEPWGASEPDGGKWVPGGPPEYNLYT